MSVETHRVLIGANGWKHSSWLNTFYDEDLPEDWQLGFYANEFPVVYVAASDWLDVLNPAESDLSEWKEDVADSFRFILEIPSSILNDDVAFSDALNKASELNEFCLGFVFQLEQNICDEGQFLLNKIELAQAIAPVCFTLQNAVLSEESKNSLREKNVTQVWDGLLPIDEEGSALGRLMISYVATQDLDMPALRKVIETCLSASNDECISVLILAGDPPSLEVLKNADILLNLV